MARGKKSGKPPARAAAAARSRAPPPATPGSVSAALLKEQGNVLFAERKHDEAATKYTEAIALDGANAVLFANRAACWLALQRWKDAAEDAAKSVEIDDKYAKGWARLATAQKELGEHASSISSFEQALAALPTSNLSTAEAKQKKDYEDALVAARAPSASSNKPGAGLADASGDMPWDVALRMRPQLEKAGVAGRKSSAWATATCCENFKAGVLAMRRPQPRDANNLMAWSFEVLEHFSNALLIESRVASIMALSGALGVGVVNLTEKVSMHVYIAARIANVDAWLEGSAEDVLRDAPGRLARDGWSALRAALSVTIWAWLMMGWVRGPLGRQTAFAEARLTNVVRLLRDGGALWESVPVAKRGPIFDTPRFARAAQALHLAYYNHAQGGPEGDPAPPGAHTREGLRALAEDMLRACRAEAAEYADRKVHPVHVHMYHANPTAYALMTLAQWHEAEADRVQDADWPAALRHMEAAADCYVKEADALPEDDEAHAYALRNAVVALCAPDPPAPLRVTLPLLARMRVAAEKSRVLWRSSLLQRAGRDERLERMRVFEDEMREAVAQGFLTLDSRADLEVR